MNDERYEEFPVLTYMRTFCIRLYQRFEWHPKMPLNHSFFFFLLFLSLRYVSDNSWHRFSGLRVFSFISVTIFTSRSSSILHTSSFHDYLLFRVHIYLSLQITSLRHPDNLAVLMAQSLVFPVRLGFAVNSYRYRLYGCPLLRHCLRFIIRCLF